MRRAGLAVLVGVLLAGAAGAVSASRADAARAQAEALAIARVEDDRRVLDANIRLFEDAARIDSASATFPARLAGLLLQRSRVTASDDDVRRAEASARRSLALRTSHNDEAATVLVAVLLARHRFSEAQELAEALVNREPESPLYRAMLGEVQTERGDYRAARASFRAIPGGRSRPAVAVRRARYLEITGRVAEARGIVEGIGRQLRERDDLPRSEIAWYYLRAGDLNFREGRLRSAELAYREGLLIAPADHRLLAGLARLEAARGRWSAARVHGESALSAAFDPAALMVLRDVAIATGDTAQVAGYDRALELVAFGGEEPPHRALSLALLDRGQRVGQILALAQRDIEIRPDVYGHDVLAWALHKSGRHVEAQAAMTQALAQRTQDALMYFHAGVIAHAAGDAPLARLHLTHALDLNPRFAVAHPAHARALLDSLADRQGR